MTSTGHLGPKVSLNDSEESAKPEIQIDRRIVIHYPKPALQSANLLFWMFACSSLSITAAQNTAAQDAVSQNTAAQDAVSQNTVAQDTAAQNVVTFESVPAQREAITGDEPLAEQFSAKQAAIYLDRAALTWQKEKKCVTCHTNMPYLIARPALASIQKDSGEVRQFFEQYRTVRWKKKGPTENQGFWPIVVGTGLTFNDLQTTGKLSPVARDVLDLLWTVQREDGGWRWPDCDYAPMEIDDHYGVTLAALTVGIAPDGYAQTEAAKAGLAKLRTYLKNNPPKSLHHRAMIAWCSLRVAGIASDQERATTLDQLLANQRPDGGWSTAGFLTDWQGLQRSDGQPLDTETSDAYGTGLVIVISRELGTPADDPRLKRGIQWLLSNQRESGKWFTRSPVNDAGNLISNTGSALAVLALQSCGTLPGWPFQESH